MVKAAGIPTYRTRFSKHEFNQHQRLSLLIFKEYLGVKYRQLCDILELNGDITKILGCSRIPHYSTLCKFSHRISSKLISKVLQKITSLFYRSYGRISTIAVDSTGFPTSYFSYYYSVRALKERKGFLKVSLAVDTQKQTILSLKITGNRQHDSQHVQSLLRNASRINWRIITFLIKDTILKLFIDRSGKRSEGFPISQFVTGMLRMSGDFFAKKW